MKINHKVRPDWTPRAVVYEAYQAEVDRSVEKAERLYARAQARLEKAEQRLARAEAQRGAASRRRLVAELAAEVELRRKELAHYARLMTQTAAGANHRGHDSYRPVAQGGWPL